MSRYYLCKENSGSSFTCQYYKSLYEIQSMNVEEHKSYGDLFDPNAQTLTPVYGKTVSVYSIPSYVPMIFDRIVLKYRVFQWPTLKVHSFNILIKK